MSIGISENSSSPRNGTFSLYFQNCLDSLTKLFSLSKSFVQDVHLQSHRKVYNLKLFFSFNGWPAFVLLKKEIVRVFCNTFLLYKFSCSNTKNYFDTIEWSTKKLKYMCFCCWHHYMVVFLLLTWSWYRRLHYSKALLTFLSFICSTIKKCCERVLVIREKVSVPTNMVLVLTRLVQGLSKYL